LETVVEGLQYTEKLTLPIMAILDRYIIREILTPLAVILAILVFILASYTAAEYMADAVLGLLPPGTVMNFVALKIAASMEVLLPITFYLSIIIAFGRMYQDLEVIGLQAGGVSGARLMVPVFWLAVAVGLAVAYLSMNVRPWAYEEIYQMKEEAKSNFDLSRVEAGNYYELDREDMEIVIFAEQVDNQARLGKKVFIRSERNGEIKVIFADRFREEDDAPGGAQFLKLWNGWVYEFARNADNGKITEFQKATYFLEPFDDPSSRYRRKAAGTIHLMRSERLEDIAEFQWRLSMPIAALLLSLLALPLSKTQPRQGKYAKMFLAVVVFAFYYNITAVSKNWVEKGIISPLIGVWWVHALMAALVVTMLWQPDIFFRSRGSRHFAGGPGRYRRRSKYLESAEKQSHETD
jgi:lipopolysaccharide export system permease protein